VPVSGALGRTLAHFDLELRPLVVLRERSPRKKLFQGERPNGPSWRRAL